MLNPRANHHLRRAAPNCDDDVDSITKLVIQLIRRLPSADPDHQTVKTQVELFKESVRQLSKSDDNQAGDDVQGEISSPKLFEEIKVMFQDLPSRIERVMITPRSQIRTRNPRISPRTVERIVTESMKRTDAPVGLGVLIWGSFLRDDLPWLYELSVQVFNASNSGDIIRERQALASLISVAASFQGVYPEELRVSQRYYYEMYRLLEYIPRIGVGDEIQLPIDIPIRDEILSATRGEVDPGREAEQSG